MKKFIIRVQTNWCGEDLEYSAIANEFQELDDIAQELAFDNFNSFDGITGILEELFPDEEEYTYEMRAEAEEVQMEYYSYTIDEWDDSRPEEEWGWYELVYNGEENNAIL